MLTIITIFSYVFWVGLALGLLIFVHELGHFLAAKLFGMRVEQFSIGFPPKLLGKQIGETEYRIGAIPLGGYVKISGMIDESMDTEYEGRSPQPWEFRAKPVWQRVIVISAGVVFNVILAGLIFIGLKWHYGEVYFPANRVQSVYVAPTSVAEQVGFRTGDRIVAVNDTPLDSYDDFRSLRALTADQVTFTVERQGQPVVLEAPDDLLAKLNQAEGIFGIDWMPSIAGGVVSGGPAYRAGLQPGDRIVALNGEQVSFWQEMVDRLQESDGSAISVRFARPDSLMTEALPPGVSRVGRIPAADLFEAALVPDRNAEGRLMIGIIGPTADQLRALFGIQLREYGLGSAIAAGTRETVNWVHMYTIFIQRLFTGRDNVRESVGGPLLIAQATKQAADRSMFDFWRLVATLSIALAIFNILPIPALDGGYLVFLAYEGITRREPSLRVRMVVQQIGMVLILMLMVFVIFNDAMRIF
jgi:regulator of sigma E protease